MRAPWAVLAVTALLLRSASCDIVKDTLDHDDRSIVLVARPFGFEANGMVDVKVTNWRVYLEAGRPEYDPKKIGFFITTAEAEVQLQQDLQAGAPPVNNAVLVRRCCCQSCVVSASAGTPAPGHVCLPVFTRSETRVGDGSIGLPRGYFPGLRTRAHAC